MFKKFKKQHLFKKKYTYLLKHYYSVNEIEIIKLFKK